MGDDFKMSELVSKANEYEHQHKRLEKEIYEYKKQLVAAIGSQQYEQGYSQQVFDFTSVSAVQ